jgi:hypothetical protein
MMISQEMIYAGGNNWVLERLEVIEDMKVYFRLSDTMFARSDMSFEDIQTGLYQYMNDYWEIGACNWDTTDVHDELIEAGLWTIFCDMVEVWQHDPKKLIAAIKEAHEPYLNGLICRMAEAKQHIDNTVWAEGNDNPTEDDIQIVIASKQFNIGSFHTDVVDLVWHLLDDIQKYAANEIL